MHIAHNPDYIIVRRGQVEAKLKEVIDSLRLEPVDFFAAKRDVGIATIQNRTVIIYEAEFELNREIFRKVLRICGDVDVYVLIGEELYVKGFLSTHVVLAEIEGGLLCLPKN